MLSPHLLGWPAHRPRSYVVMTKKDSCYLDLDGIQGLTNLYVRPALPVSAFFCAPEDMGSIHQLAGRLRLVVVGSSYILHPQTQTHITRMYFVNAGRCC